MPPNSTKTAKTYHIDDYYDRLQVSPKADPEIIEAAYRRLALKYHPDHNSTPAATEQMQAINQAYHVLKDPQKRLEYDRELGRVIDDLMDDDYEPPYRRRSYSKPLWTENTSLAWWIVGGLIAVLLLVWITQNTGTQAAVNQPTSTAVVPTPTLPPGVLFYDDLEQVAGANWRLDTPWHLTSRYSHSGKYSLWFGDEKQGQYAPNLSTAATLARSITLSKPANLSFWLAGQSDHTDNPTGEDRLFVEVAPAGQDFQTIFTANGLYAGWQQFSLDLSRWQGQDVLVRFRFSSGVLNSGAGFTGFFIDDIEIN